jgi:hypothetical protein
MLPPFHPNESPIATISGWSEVSFSLIKFYLDGLKINAGAPAGHQEPGRPPSQQYAINKLIYRRVTSPRHRDPSGMWLYGWGLPTRPLIYTPDLHIGYGDTGTAYGVKLLSELGFAPALIQNVTATVRGRDCHVEFNLLDGEWFAKQPVRV